MPEMSTRNAPPTLKMHKFGGTSLSSADAYRNAASIVATSGDEVAAVVVSATAGMTDRLLGLVDATVTTGAPDLEALQGIRHSQLAMARELLSEKTVREVEARIDADIADIEDVLRGLAVAGRTDEDATSFVIGYGELWSALLLASHLTDRGEAAAVLDARKVLVVERASLGAVVDWETTRSRLETWLAESQPFSTMVITGFIASDGSGRATTLGRNGSDYSASIFGALLGASEIVIWTDVGGMMSADPRLVPQAHVLSDISYNEAMELAYFGAKVLHPATMSPAVEAEIPILIRDATNPGGPGTRIHSGTDGSQPVKGFASISDIALLNLEGTAMINVPGIAFRLFGALGEVGVSVVMISQGSSEHSICFAIPAEEAPKAKEAAESAFAAELRHGQIRGIDITSNCTILAAVGDGMSGTPGIAARLFGALAHAGVNVRAIAQGASERNISIVIDSDDAARALRAAHAGFYLSAQTLSIGLIGPGHVGATLLDQMSRQIDWLREAHGIDLRVRAVAASSRMIVDHDRIDLATWRERLADETSTQPTDLDAVTDIVKTETVPHPVIIDCTADAAVADRYAEWLSRGIHVVTPNKKAGSGPLQQYDQIRRDASWAGAHYFYETTVGAALPIIQTLRDLLHTGDRVIRVEGIFSGTLSYLFNSFDGSTPFSEIVAMARGHGYTEPDPREDLSGMDVARKVVILAREMGMSVELGDLKVEGLVPAGLEQGSVEDFLDRLSAHDDGMLALFEEASGRDEVIRFVGTIDRETGCDVALRTYKSDHPFARIQLTDNIVLFHTARYSENPLVIQGPGAGPDVTAGGVFADVLRLANYLGSTI